MGLWDWWFGASDARQAKAADLSPATLTCSPLSTRLADFLTDRHRFAVIVFENSADARAFDTRLRQCPPWPPHPEIPYPRYGFRGPGDVTIAVSPETFREYPAERVRRIALWQGDLMGAEAKPSPAVQQIWNALEPIIYAYRRSGAQMIYTTW